MSDKYSKQEWIREMLILMARHEIEEIRKQYFQEIRYLYLEDTTNLIKYKE